MNPGALPRPPPRQKEIVERGPAREHGVMKRIARAFLVLALAGAANLSAQEASQTLAPDHPDYRAVRAILDANGLTKKKVEGVSVVEDGRIVELYLQEGGVRVLPDDIGRLTRLRRLHLYGDPELGLPLLEKVSPELARCADLEELLLNGNNLTSLPEQLADLRKIKILSVADNRLGPMAARLEAWLERHDPRGFRRQRP